MTKHFIREARPGDESAIHEAHMRSIREICVKDHGEDEIRGWGYRELGNRWVDAITQGYIWVVEFEGTVKGLGYIKIFDESKSAYLHALYLTPEVLGMRLGFQIATLMIEKAREQGAEIIDLDSTITAHGFYKSLGFEDNDTMKWVEIGGYPVRCFPMKLKLR